MRMVREGRGSKGRGTQCPDKDMGDPREPFVGRTRDSEDTERTPTGEGSDPGQMGPLLVRDVSHIHTRLRCKRTLIEKKNSGKVRGLRVYAVWRHGKTNV